MNDVLKNTINSIMYQADDPEVSKMFVELFDLPDSQFEQIYPTMKQSFSEIFNTPQAQQELFSELSKIPNLNLDSEQQSIDFLFKTIEEDTTLSEQKKDILNTLASTIKQATENFFEVHRERIPVQIVKCHPDAILPSYAHPTDAGADVCAVEEVTLKPHTTQIIKTGLKVAIPVGYMINIAPRSGLSAKTSLRIANTWGIIDSKRGLIHA